MRATRRSDAPVPPPPDAGAAVQAPPSAARTAVAARIGGADDRAPVAPVLRPNADRGRHAISTQVSTPLHVREASGGVTPLKAWAAAAAAGAQAVALPAAASTGLGGRVAQAWRSAVGGSEPVAWLQQRLQSLRAEALDGHPPAEGARPATLLPPLQRGGLADPVARFWRQPEVAAGAHLGPQHAPLAAELDRIGHAHGVHVGLGLSFALLSAVRGGGPAASPAALRAFQGPDPVPRVLATAAAGGADAQATIGLEVLRKAARSNQFPALARAMAPALRDEQLAPLRRFLEADAALVAEAWPADGMTARSDSALSMAERVREAARRQLETGMPLDGRQQKVDAFLWDNRFRDDGPGSPLAAAKQHFGAVVSSLAAEPRTGGLLSAAYAFGLSGADRHLLSDEAARLGRLRDSESLDRLVGSLRDVLRARLAADGLATGDAWAADRTAISLARLLALDDWSPERKGTLSPQELVRGRAHARDDAALRARVAGFCERLELGGDEEAGFHAAPGADPARLHARVHGELSLARMGFEDLFRLAAALQVPLDAEAQRLAEDAATVIHGHTRKPGERTPAAVGEMLGGFLDEVQFGNHARLSHLSSATLSARGAGLNTTAFGEGGALADLGPRQAGLAVVPAVNFAFERAREQVLRAGAATHGVEIFLGHSDEAVNAEGVGIAAAYPNDRSLPLRASVGVDTLYNGLRTTCQQGVMFRIDRRIVEDRDDGQGGRAFAQNDADVRRTAGSFARMLLDGAPAARSEAQREALLESLIERFHDQGLSMSLLDQRTRTHRTEVNAGLGLSAAMGPSHAGARVGGSVGLGLQYAPATELTQRDTTGSYQVTVERRGWYARTRVSGGASANVYLGPAGLPPVPVVRGSDVRDERGGAVRVRIPTREGCIVPEKTFSDIDTASPALLKDIVRSRRDEWTALFAYPHRHEPDGGRARGEQALEEFFYTIDAVRAGNQRYYTRERLHPDVGQRLDELASLATLAPPALSAVRDELAHQRRELLADARSWAPASLIAYERHAVEQGAAGGLGVQGRHVMAAEGEREFVFHTPGWAMLRARERDGTARPASVDDADRRARDATGPVEI